MHRYRLPNGSEGVNNALAMSIRIVIQKSLFFAKPGVERVLRYYVNTRGGVYEGETKEGDEGLWGFHTLDVRDSLS